VFGVVAIFVTLFVVYPADAEDEEVVTRTFLGEASLGYTQTGGNSDVLSVRGSSKLIYNLTAKKKFILETGLSYTETSGVKAAEDYTSDLRFSNDSGTRFYFFTLAGWERDVFSGLDNRFYVGQGAGAELLASKAQTLEFETSVQRAWEAYTDGTGNEFYENAVSVNYEHFFSHNLRIYFENDYSYNFAALSAYEVDSELGASTRINPRLTLKMSYRVEYQNEPSSEDIRRTDRTFITSVGIDF
jgi:putative salt-induced outer membrane protein